MRLKSHVFQFLDSNKPTEKTERSRGQNVHFLLKEMCIDQDDGQALLQDLWRYYFGLVAAGIVQKPSEPFSRSMDIRKGQ